MPTRSVRIDEGLYAEVCVLAESQHRPIVAQLELLLRKALGESSGSMWDRGVPADRIPGFVQGPTIPEPAVEHVFAEKGAGASERRRKPQATTCTAYCPRGTKCKACGKVH